MFQAQVSCKRPDFSSGIQVCKQLSSIKILWATSITLLALTEIYMQENYRNKNKMFFMFHICIIIKCIKNTCAKTKIKISDDMLIKKENWSFQTFKNCKNIQIWWMCIKKSPRSVWVHYFHFHIRQTLASAGHFFKCQEIIHFYDSLFLTFLFRPYNDFAFHIYHIFSFNFHNLLLFQTKKWFDVVVFTEKGPISTRWILLEEA